MDTRIPESSDEPRRRDLSDLTIYSPEGRTYSEAEAITITTDAVQPLALTKLRLISGIGLFFTVAAGAGGTYLLTRKGLRPVKEMNSAVAGVDARRLGTRLSLDNVEDELKELGESFNHMMGRLESDFEHQQRFVSDAAHELRVPLASLRATLEDVRSDPGATIEDYLGLALLQERMVTRLERLIGDLRILGMRHDIPLVETVSLGVVLEETRLDLEHLAAQRNVKVQLKGELDLVVQGDELLLGRAFCNLVENAIAYNRPGGNVAVTAWQDGHHAVVEVADTGIGIALDDQPRIFERLYRGRGATSKNAGGTGLGLAIVRHIVEAHGGSIQVQSQPGAGSAFTVRLLLAPQD
jgi:signal transduction histidine kinase